MRGCGGLSHLNLLCFGVKELTLRWGFMCPPPTPEPSLPLHNVRLGLSFPDFQIDRSNGLYVPSDEARSCCEHQPRWRVGKQLVNEHRAPQCELLPSSLSDVTRLHHFAVRRFVVEPATCVSGLLENSVDLSSEPPGRGSRQPAVLSDARPVCARVCAARSPWAVLVRSAEWALRGARSPPGLHS